MKSQAINSTELTLEVQSRHAVDRESCFNELLKRFHGQALSTAWRLLGNHHAQAEDTVQTAFQKAWENFEQLENPNRLKSWFFQILVNECRNVQRRHKTRKTLRQIFLPWEQETEQPAEPDHGIQKRIQHAMQKLSARQREAFVLTHLEGFTNQEAASMMQASIGTLKSHLHRATTTLRQELHDIHPHAEETR